MKARCFLVRATVKVEDVKVLREDIKEDYTRVCKAVPEFSNNTFEDFMRVRTLVNSRIFGTYIKGEEDDSMVPFADMFNYKWKTDMTKWKYDDDAEAFTVVANEDVPRGEEVYLSYGHKANRAFFLFYGFVIDGNENDFAYLNVSLNSDDRMKYFKDELLDVNAFPRKCRLGCAVHNRNFRNTMSFLRFVEYEGDEAFLKNLRDECVKESTEAKPVYFKGKNIKPISKENEMRALKTLRVLCRDALLDYPTTLDEDLELLKDETLTFNQRNAIVYRKSEKLIYKFYIEFADKVGKWLKHVLL